MLKPGLAACAAAVLLTAGFGFSQATGTDSAGPKAASNSSKDKSTKGKAKAAPPPDGVNDNQPGVEAGREARLDTKTNLQLQVAILINGPIDSSSGAAAGQEYSATLDAPLMAGTRVIAPRGTRALLRIAPAGDALELQLVALEVGGKMLRTDGSRLAPEETRGIDLQPKYSASGARIQVPAGTRLNFTLPGAATAPATAPAGTAAAVSLGGWLLSVSGCGAEAGRSIACSLTLANLGADRAAVVAAGTTGYDAAGNAYRVGSSQVGRAANPAVLSAGSRVPVTITFANAAANVRIVRLQVVLSWGNAAEERATFSFAGVPQVGR